jgi:hypothetical protein
LNFRFSVYAPFSDNVFYLYFGDVMEGQVGGVHKVFNLRTGTSHPTAGRFDPLFMLDNGKPVCSKDLPPVPVVGRESGRAFVRLKFGDVCIDGMLG